jgi:hypothetical protein
MPSAYDFSMEGVDDDISGRLSTTHGDDILDESNGWVRSKSLQGNWISVARTDASKGEKARVLIRAVP